MSADIKPIKCFFWLCPRVLSVNKTVYSCILLSQNEISRWPNVTNSKQKAWENCDSKPDLRQTFLRPRLFFGRLGRNSCFYFVAGPALSFSETGLVLLSFTPSWASTS